ncbi:hypothetical protein [Rhizobium sp.]|uniref:hypothetical protein n=1 Tax=Rhizobium sp. TaxID=391 RepID=UPI002AA93DD8
MARRSTLTCLLLILFAGALTPATATELDELPPQVTFAISGGRWEDPGESGDNGIVKSPKLANNAQSAAKSIGRGYYRLVAVQQPDHTGKVFLQQMQMTDAGSQLIDRVELQEISDLHAIVTDIRTDDTSGINRSLGFLATVYVKTNPKSADPDSWNVIIDEFGEIQVARESH